MPLVDQPFEDTFTFSRRGRATCRDADGVEVVRKIDVPRFDHSVDGEPRGLLVSGRPEAWHPDRLRIQPGDWATIRGTVLHEYEAPDGQIVQRAWYAPVDPVAAVDACLNIKGWHREIVYIPTLLRNRDGFVRWGRRDWLLGSLVLVEPGVALATAGSLILLEG